MCTTLLPGFHESAFETVPALGCAGMASQNRSVIRCLNFPALCIDVAACGAGGSGVDHTRYRMCSVHHALQHAAVAAVASLLRLPVCRDAAAWLAGELHRAALHPVGKTAGVRGTAAQGPITKMAHVSCVKVP